MEAKRIERTEDAVVIFATGAYLAANTDICIQINQLHPNCEAIFLMCDEQTAIASINPDIDDAQRNAIKTSIESIYAKLNALFVKRTFAYSNTKHCITPHFAGQMIDKDKTKRGFVVKTNDPIYKTDQYRNMCSIIEQYCDTFKIELLT